jgi:hypothetical protein
MAKKSTVNEIFFFFHSISTKINKKETNETIKKTKKQKTEIRTIIEDSS